MRLSTIEGDPGHRAWLDLRAAGRTAKVLLNGIERSHVVTADESERFILRHIEGEHGEVLLDVDCEHFATEVLYGEVAIVPVIPGARDTL